MRRFNSVRDERAFYEEVGRRIRAARGKRAPKLTQEALAGMVSLARTSITNVERGRQKLLLHTLADIADALQVDPSTLLPSASSAVAKLDAALGNRPTAEKNWIKATLTSAEHSENDHGA